MEDSTPPLPPPRTLRDKYHHVIPRCILTRYQNGPPMTQKQRKLGFCMTGKDPRTLRYYDLKTHTLEDKSPSDAYRVTNLNRNFSYPVDLKELENKLVLLEEAAKSVIDNIHRTIDSGTVAMPRRDVETLRKFLFITYYRKNTLLPDNFLPDRPQEKPHLPWINNMLSVISKGRGLGTPPADRWLYFLCYYLDTPHTTLAEKYDHVSGRWGAISTDSATGLPLKYTRDASLESYMAQSAFYFLGIWRAAPGREFIITSNGFALWEGRYSSLNHLHRLFVISPTVALVLRVNDTPRFRFSGVPVASDFAKVDMQPPACQPADPDQYNQVFGCAWPDVYAESVYYRSGAGQKDIFSFTVPSLTQKQTDDMNFILLRNINMEEDVAAFSFLDARVCAEMLSRYVRIDVRREDMERAEHVRPLLALLEKEVGEVA